MKRICLGLLVLCVLFGACKSDKKKEPVTTIEPATPVALLPFDADSAYSFVAAQTAFGPRVPNSEAHKACADYLIQKMSEYCDTVIAQRFTATTYDGNRLAAVNIISSFAPEKKNRILLGAHWDSRHIADHDPNTENRNNPIDGANDGASGVGVLMELARQLQLANPEVGVDIIFFDAEDYGTPNSEDIPGDWWCLGSQYWAKNKHRADYQAEFGILLDMVGAANATFYHEGVSARYANPYLSKVWGVANKLGYGAYFINKASNPVTDDHYYINTMAKIPMINIIHQDMNGNTGFFPYWHTTQDNINIIDKHTLFVVGQTLMHVILEFKP